MGAWVVWGAWPCATLFPITAKTLDLGLGLLGCDSRQRAGSHRHACDQQGRTLQPLASHSSCTPIQLCQQHGGARRASRLFVRSRAGSERQLLPRVLWHRECRTDGWQTLIQRPPCLLPPPPPPPPPAAAAAAAWLLPPVPHFSQAPCPCDSAGPWQAREAQCGGLPRDHCARLRVRGLRLQVRACCWLLVWWSDSGGCLATADSAPAMTAIDCAPACGLLCMSAAALPCPAPPHLPCRHPPGHRCCRADEVQLAGQYDGQGVRLRLAVPLGDAAALGRQVLKSDTATIRCIPGGSGVHRLCGWCGMHRFECAAAGCCSMAITMQRKEHAASTLK